MKLITSMPMPNTPVHAVSTVTVAPDAPRGGQMYSYVQLSEADFQWLNGMPDANLKEWVRTWNKGFRPVDRSVDNRIGRRLGA